MEICSDTSPKYRCRYCVVNNFDRLTIDEVVAVFSHSWVICIPFLEIDVNITIYDLVCSVWISVSVSVFIDAYVF